MRRSRGVDEERGERRRVGRAGVPLEVRAVPVVIECRQCSMHTELDDPIFRCGACGSTETTVVSGDELFVTSLDLTIDA